MNIIICIDKNKGMMFNNRRQSQDAVLRDKIISICNGAKLLMSSYSETQFSAIPDIVVNDDFLTIAEPGDFCFVENGILPSVENIENVILFNWNRKYPADVFFELDLKASGFKRESKEEFAGASHDKITLEIYKRV